MNNSDITFLLIAILAICGGGGYLYLNNQDNKNKKTRKNKQIITDRELEDNLDSEESDSGSDSGSDESYLDIDTGNLEDIPVEKPKRKYTKRKK